MNDKQLAEYSTEIMDDIDECKQRGAVGDLSALAYRLVQKIVDLSIDLREAEENKKGE